MYLQVFRLRDTPLFTMHGGSTNALETIEARDNENIFSESECRRRDYDYYDNKDRRERLVIREFFSVATFVLLLRLERISTGKPEKRKEPPRCNAPLLKVFLPFN